MGLDIYLNTRAEVEAEEAYEKAWDAYYVEWGEKEDGPEKEAARKSLPAYTSSSDVPSEKYPDHLFNRRYLRSSYNPGGFNSAVPDIVGQDHGLYWIFEPVIKGSDEPYETVLVGDHVPGLNEVKERALQVAQELRDSDPLRAEAITTIDGHQDHLWSSPPTEDQALDWYRAERKRNDEAVAKRIAEGREKSSWDTEDGGYISAKGSILGFTKGIEVLAVTVGMDALGSSGSFAGLNNRPAAIIIYRLSQETKESYIQSAEIVAEFCDEAINLIESEKTATMRWSG